MRCPCCGKIMDGDISSFCVDCLSKLPRTAERGDEFVSHGKTGAYVFFYAAPFYYDGIFRTAFTRFKFRNKSAYASAFAMCMAESWRKAMNGTREGDKLRPDVITWIPVSAQRRRERGYDQSELLAKCVGDYLGVPVVPILRKTGDNKPQSSLDTSARAANVIGMYEICSDAPDITGKTVLLIDDILTTGATAREAAFVLDSVRPRRICCLFAAKTEKSRREKRENFCPTA